MVRLSQRVAHECREEFIIIHYDLAIANPALQIQVSEDPTYNNVFICFGPFHIELAYFGALGHFLDCSGSPHKFTETEVLAPGPLNGFLHGKCFNRTDIPENSEKLDINDEYSGRLLHQAAIYDNVDLTQSLLEGPEKDHIDAQDSYGRTALYTAVTNNSFECGHLLLQAGANPNLSCGPECYSMTPLHAAALENNHTFVSLLFDYGADTELKDIDGNTPYKLAEKNNNEGCCILLQERIARRKRQKEQLEQEFKEAVIEGDVMQAKHVAEDIPEADLIQIINRIPKGENCLLFR
ncbi:hypothetical protein LSH36_9g14013 [Paralvinella palmiformis]|uniref:Uncharacterized protein n=1 Tax=Paralvinella palmiformis TaxID=53620 RepID=A0AAD9NGL3_9ANNE|nr:hypothetical protein LSH36_9g14013 [Paralvinella palmiformis]